MIDSFPDYEGFVTGGVIGLQTYLKDHYPQPQEQAMSIYMNEYQVKAAETATYDDPMYPIASLMVESSELADLFIKPWLRGDDGDPDRAEVLAEAGDVMWNLAALLTDMNITLDEVAEYNLKKLKSRKERGVIAGSGGNR
jgi:NTP pyrophosphatase (non-canonical NTP hydrolase)